MMTVVLFDAFMPTSQLFDFAFSIPLPKTFSTESETVDHSPRRHWPRTV